MILATVYKGLSNRPQVLELPEGKTVAQCFPGEDLENAAIFANSEAVGGDYVLRDGDCLLVRFMPGLVTAAIVLASVAVAAAIGVGIYAGVQIYKQKKELAALQEQLESMQSSTGSDLDNRPFLRGASNTAATSKTQPYICGRHLFTPYLLADTFYELSGTDGEDQYANIILEGGFGPQVIDTVGTDDVNILELSDTEPQEGVYQTNAGSVFADGTVEIRQSGALMTSNSALNYKHVVTTCNEEVPRTSDIEDADSDVEDYVFTLDSHAVDVEICASFTSGLYAYDSDGNKIETSVTITPEYSLDGGSTWQSFTFDNNGTATNTFKRLISTKELRYMAKKTFTLADYEALYSNGQSTIYCRVRSSGANDSQICNTCYILYYQSLCFDPNTSSSPAGSLDDGGSAGLVPCLAINERERKKSVMIGVRLKATSSNEDKLGKIFIISSGMARTWGGYSWSSEKAVTRNPAAWALEVLTSDTHALSKFDDSEIDLEAFGDWYEFCEENGYNFDYVISSKSKKETVLGYITDAACAVLYNDIYGRKSVAIDRAQENAVAIYNPQNVISIENEREFARRTDCVRVTYTSSEDDLFEEDTVSIMREVDGVALELDEDTVITEVTANGITEYEHAAKYARRCMAIEILRPKKTTIEVGNEGIFLTPYSKVLLQDDSLKIGTGSSVVKSALWEGDKATALLLKSPVTVEEGKSYGAIVECYTETGTSRIALKVAAEAGEAVEELELLTELRSSDSAVPSGGEVLSFGELDDEGEFSKITTPYMISGISRTESGFSLELVNYDEAIYDSGTIPEYRSNITQRPPSSQAAVPDDFVSRDELYEAVTTIAAGITEGTSGTVGEPDVPSSLQAVVSRDGIEISCTLGDTGLRNEVTAVTFYISKHNGAAASFEASGAQLSYAFDRSSDGYPEAEDLALWRVKAKARNAYGKESGWSSEASLTLTGYLTWKAPPLSLESCSASQSGISSSWAASGNLTYGTMRYNWALSYGGEAVASKEGLLLSSYEYGFNRSSDQDGYPETHDAIARLADAGQEAMGRDLSLYSVRMEGYTLEAPDHIEEISAIPDSTYYGTWIPAEISAVTASAYRDYVEVSASAYPSASNWGTPYTWLFAMSRDGGETWTEWTAASSTTAYYFDRDIDGYPEAEGLQGWRFRAKAKSSAGVYSINWGGGSSGVAASTASYGTWTVSEPTVVATVSGRTITLSMSQPTLASQKDRYGTFCHRLQIQKPSESTEWWKPAQNLDPYADEGNWKDGEGYVVAEATYTQTMPLTGQTLQTVEVEGETVRQSSPEATLYRFRIVAYSEAGEAEAVEVNATALPTGIQDIVMGSVTHDKISTPSLSAITANMGVITSGGFTGSELNYWFLSTVQGMEAYGFNNGYEGAFRVGGEDEYLIVEPQVTNGQVTGYRMSFKAGAFEITTEATTVNGEIVVQASEDALDRTRITPTGTYFEHRESSESSDWAAASQVRVDGIKTGLVRSDQHLVLTNMGTAERRKLGHDIGRPYLSEKARVWHFDTDFLDQDGEEGLAVAGSCELVDAESYPDGGIDFTPAILSVAPFAEDAKVAWGQFSASIACEASNAFTLDFWIQYIWNEGQTLLDAANEAEGVRLTVRSDECYWNDYQEGRDAAPFNAEQLVAGDTVVWNTPLEAEEGAILEHYSSVGQSESLRLASLGVEFGQNQWLHMAVVFTASSIAVYMGGAQVSFSRYATAATAVAASLNDAQNSFVLDELYVDAGAAETFAQFSEGTEKRIPWGALDYGGGHFVIDAESLSTNIFETDAFKAAVRKIIDGG